MARRLGKFCKLISGTGTSWWTNWKCRPCCVGWIHCMSKVLWSFLRSWILGLATYGLLFDKYLNIWTVGNNRASVQRAILNFTPGPQEWPKPLGVNLAPRGEICPLGVMFAPSFTLTGEHYLLFRRMEGRTENFTPRGQTSPLGDNFAPWGKVLPSGRS
jgi:hypothetical protein